MGTWVYSSPRYSRVTDLASMLYQSLIWYFSSSSVRTTPFVLTQNQKLHNSIPGEASERSIGPADFHVLHISRLSLRSPRWPLANPQAKILTKVAIRCGVGYPSPQWSDSADKQSCLPGHELTGNEGINNPHTVPCLPLNHTTFYQFH